MRFKLLFIFAVCALQAGAQTIHVDDGTAHWEIGMGAGLNNDGYQVDFSGAVFPISNFGLKATIGFAGEIGSLEYWYDDYWDSYYNYYDNYTVRFKFTPAIVLRSPCIATWKKQDAGFYLFAEPGITLSPGASGSRDARTFHWDCKVGLNLQVDRIIATLGYDVSNFSLYSGRPYSEYSQPDRDNYVTHCVYLAIAVKL